MQVVMQVVKIDVNCFPLSVLIVSDSRDCRYSFKLLGSELGSSHASIWLLCHQFQSQISVRSYDEDNNRRTFTDLILSEGWTVSFEVQYQGSDSHLGSLNCFLSFEKRLGTLDTLRRHFIHIISLT
ncbi:hypothetical protein MPTK2_3g20320 [Marchantia polymorpha subsp. ruderalis]